MGVACVSTSFQNKTIVFLTSWLLVAYTTTSNPYKNTG